MPNENPPRRPKRKPWNEAIAAFITDGVLSIPLAQLLLGGTLVIGGTAISHELLIKEKSETRRKIEENDVEMTAKNKPPIKTEKNDPKNDPKATETKSNTSRQNDQKLTKEEKQANALLSQPLYRSKEEMVTEAIEALNEICQQFIEGVINGLTVLSEKELSKEIERLLDRSDPFILQKYRHYQINKKIRRSYKNPSKAEGFIKIVKQNNQIRANAARESFRILLKKYPSISVTDRDPNLPRTKQINRLHSLIQQLKTAYEQHIKRFDEEIRPKAIRNTEK